MNAHGMPSSQGTGAQSPEDGEITSAWSARTDVLGNKYL